MSDLTEYGWNDTMDMGLLQKLKADLKTALRAKDGEVKDGIRIIMSEFPKLTMPITLESGKKTTRLKTDDEITNDDIQDIVKGLVKSEKVMLEVKKEESSRYLELMHSYLPQIASKDEVVAWVKDNIDFSQFKNAMQAMGPIMKHFGKAADGTVVKEALQEVAGQ